jgi:tight adherence protein B
LDIVEVHMLSAYVRANTKFGGKLSQSLVLLIEQMSNKTRLEREIRAATAETRASATALCLLTVGVIGLVSILNKNYIAFFLDSQMGHMILAGIVTWPLVGLFVMKRILSIDY